ncbi:hypothetical protein [Microbulbifer taiwanensis]|uniref:EamA domain-containing protein n=1 Tax=Microbulbifer taiwanensis TaxID=986746 RepID=A0ABW1YNZ3_9GAMM|nr:hypothetical protein [Microbulbifer taiwanensis]
MTITALAIAAISTITFYAGMALARRIRSKLYTALLRVGALLFSFLLCALIPAALDADLRVAELAGRYYFFLMLGGAFVYKLLLVRFIPLPQEHVGAQ